MHCSTESSFHKTKARIRSNYLRREHVCIYGTHYCIRKKTFRCLVRWVWVCRKHQPNGILEKKIIPVKERGTHAIMGCSCKMICGCRSNIMGRQDNPFGFSSDVVEISRRGKCPDQSLSRGSWGVKLHKQLKWNKLCRLYMEFTYSFIILCENVLTRIRLKSH